MTMETMAAETAGDTTTQAVSAVETVLRKAWSILDAAAEKKSPSQYLSPNTISAIQGKAINPTGT